LAIIIDGKVISKQTRDELVPRIESLAIQGIIPGLRVVLIGEDPGSMSYVRSKEKVSKNLSINSEVIRFPSDIDSATVENTIRDINADDNIHGILLQLPVPDHLNADYLISLISPEKDVDGFHPENLGLLCDSRPRFVPCTPYGILKMLNAMEVSLTGKHVVIVGRSRVVGRPLSILLSNKGIDCTVTVCHSKTNDIPYYTKQADILVAAMGKPHFITKDMVKKDSIIIDVGINRVDDKLIGDVDYESVFDKVSMITPVPGGVGLMTVAMLMVNTVTAAEQFANKVKL
jgi:methylenetetrahydrofolate dehydrogenase (NADP+) / methenyltetrahydrofolate cyclohydrolase